MAGTAFSFPGQQRLADLRARFGVAATAAAVGAIQAANGVEVAGLRALGHVVAAPAIHGIRRNPGAAGIAVLSAIPAFFAAKGIVKTVTDWKGLTGKAAKTWKGLKYRALYFMPYYAIPRLGLFASATALGLGGMSLAPALGVGVGMAAVAGLATAAIDGLSIRMINNRYKVYDKKGDFSRRGLINQDDTLFARWRQGDDYKDGFHWNDDKAVILNKETVMSVLKSDKYHGRLSLKDPETGLVIKEPTPKQLIQAIDRELVLIYEDQRSLKSLQLERDVLHCKDVKKSTSWLRFLLWPTWNSAIETSADLVQMMRRLDALKAVLTELRVEIGCDDAELGCDPWTKRNILLSVNKNNNGSVKALE